MLRVATVVLLVLAVATLAWIGGEAHRRNCLSQKRANCSVLPWKAGSETTPSLQQKYGP